MGKDDRLKELAERLAAAEARADALVAEQAERTKASERRIAELEFEALAVQNARLGGVVPGGEKWLMSDIAQLFEARENMLVVKNGETSRFDPLQPLPFEEWLEDRRKELPFLFVKREG